MNRFNFFSVQGVLCFRQVSTHNIQLKVWLKEVWTITENNIKMVLGIILFNDFETIFTLLLNSFNEHNFGQFLVSLAVFIPMTNWLPFCHLKQWFLKSKFWDLSNLSTLQILLFSATNSRRFVMFVCLLGEKWPALPSLSSKQAVVLGRPGIRNWQSA